MTGVAGSHSKAGASRFEIFYLLFAFQPDFMAAAAAFHAFCQFHRQPVRCGHGVQDGPRQGMFPLLELFHSFFMAHAAGFRRRNFNIGYIFGRSVAVAVANRACDFILAVFAQLPIGYNARGDVFVAIDTYLREARCAKAHHECYYRKYDGHFHWILPPLIWFRYLIMLG